LNAIRLEERPPTVTRMLGVWSAWQLIYFAWLVVAVVRARVDEWGQEQAVVHVGTVMGTVIAFAIYASDVLASPLGGRVKFWRLVMLWTCAPVAMPLYLWWRRFSRRSRR